MPHRWQTKLNEAFQTATSRLPQNSSHFSTRLVDWCLQTMCRAGSLKLEKSKSREFCVGNWSFSETVWSWQTNAYKSWWTPAGSVLTAGLCYIAAGPNAIISVQIPIKIQTTWKEFDEDTMVFVGSPDFTPPAAHAAAAWLHVCGMYSGNMISPLFIFFSSSYPIAIHTPWL